MRLNQYKAIIGNAVTLNTITKSVQTGTFPKFSIMFGPSGTGKSGTAEITALRIRCESPINEEPCLKCRECISGLNAMSSKGKSSTLIKKDISHITSFEQVRELINEVFKIESGDKPVVFIFELFETLNKNLQSSMLEDLERIPENVYIMICTTNINSIIKDIRSRALVFRFDSLTSSNSMLLIDKLCMDNSVRLTKEVKSIIQTSSRGNPRVIANTFDFIKNNPKFSEEELSQFFGGVSDESLRTLFKSYSDMSTYLNFLSEILDMSPIGTFLTNAKDYIMDCCFLSKNISFKQTSLKPTDKSFAKTVGFNNLMKVYRILSDLRLDSELSDLQYSLILCAKLIQKGVKENYSKLNIEEEEVIEEVKNSTRIENAKINREVVSESSSKENSFITSTSFKDLVNESIRKREN